MCTLGVSAYDAGAPDSVLIDLLTLVGAIFIDRFNNLDATESFYALHSDDAVARLATMKPISSTDPVPPIAPEDVGRFG